MDTTGGGTADEETQQRLTPDQAPQSTGRRKAAAKVVNEPRIGPDPQAAAFFDLDNTMIQGASMFYLAKGLYARDIFPRKAILRALWLQLQFRFIGGENPDHIAEAQAASLSLITGLSVEQITSVCEEIYEDTYGHGAGFREAGLEITAFRVSGIGRTPKPSFAAIAPSGESHRPSSRQVYDVVTGAWFDATVAEWDRLGPETIAGPAVIEHPTTTVYVASGQQVALDAIGNLVITPTA